MRHKRDINDAHPGDSKRTSTKKTAKNNHQDNLGEQFVRYLTSKGCTNYETQYNKNNDPFKLHIPESPGDEETTTAGPDMSPSYTKFHLDDDKMLMELMMHLNSDCPDIMRNKQELLDNVSRIFDKIKP